MKFIKYIIKKFFLSCFILYGFNYIAINYNIVLPINLFNIFIVSILGPFGICGLIFFKYFILWGFYDWIVWCKKELY